VEVLDFTNRFSYPQILVGDFNEESNSEMLAFLQGEVELAGLTGNFKDAWKSLKGENDPDEWTFTTLSDKPKKRIDFIMFRGDQLVLNDINVIHNSIKEKQQPSDHRGLFADFQGNE